MIHNQYSKIKRKKEGNQILGGFVCFFFILKSRNCFRKKMQYQFRFGRELTKDIRVE